MTLSEFVTKYNGQGIDFDGAFGNQCVDLMNKYLVDVLGIANPMSVLPGSSAFEIWQNANSSLFTKVPNTPTGIPNAGDIVFWQQDATVGTSSAGHVDIFLNGDANNFQGFDQNWPAQEDANGNGTGVAHEQAHTFEGVVGWLSPSGQSSGGTISVDKNTFTKLVHNSSVSDSVNDYLSLPHDSDFAPIKAKLDQIESDKQAAQSAASGATSSLLALQTLSDVMKSKVDRIHTIVYSVWSMFPGANYFGNRLHQIKKIFEVG